MGECDCRLRDGSKRLGMTVGEARWLAGGSYGELKAEQCPQGNGWHLTPREQGEAGDTDV